MLQTACQDPEAVPYGDAVFPDAKTGNEQYCQNYQKYYIDSDAFFLHLRSAFFNQNAALFISGGFRKPVGCPANDIFFNDSKFEKFCP